jgi:hypothetical protein
MYMLGLPVSKLCMPALTHRGPIVGKNICNEVYVEINTH